MSRYMNVAVRMARIKTLERQPIGEPQGLSGELATVFLERLAFESYQCRQCGDRVQTPEGMAPLILHWCMCVLTFKK